MQSQPVANGAARVAGERVGDQGAIALWVGPVERLEVGELAGGVTGGRSRGQDVAIAHPQRTLEPDVLEPALIVQRHLDAVPVC
jgi:hypothetical protein